MTMRRLSLMLVLVAALAACSSGSNNVASSTTTPAAAPSTTPVAESPSAATTSTDDSAGGAATDYCTAFTELEKAKGAANPAAAGAAFEAAAADMRKFAPPEIKDAAETYADLMETIGKAAQASNMDEASLSKAMALGIAGKAKDVATVAKWVSTNCKL
jgi:hypothetical protein